MELHFQDQSQGPFLNKSLVLKLSNIEILKSFFIPIFFLSFSLTGHVTSFRIKF